MIKSAVVKLCCTSNFSGPVWASFRPVLQGPWPEPPEILTKTSLVNGPEPQEEMRIFLPEALIYEGNIKCLQTSGSN